MWKQKWFYICSNSWYVCGVFSGNICVVSCVCCFFNWEQSKNQVYSLDLIHYVLLLETETRSRVLLGLVVCAVCFVALLLLPSANNSGGKLIEKQLCFLVSANFRDWQHNTEHNWGACPTPKKKNLLITYQFRRSLCKEKGREGRKGERRTMLHLAAA